MNPVDLSTCDEVRRMVLALVADYWENWKAFSQGTRHNMKTVTVWEESAARTRDSLLAHLKKYADKVAALWPDLGAKLKDIEVRSQGVRLSKKEKDLVVDTVLSALREDALVCRKKGVV